MKAFQKQTGNIVMIVLSIIGSLLVIGILGFVLWSNFINVGPKVTPNNAGTSTQKETTPEPVDKIAFDATLGSGFAVKYPESWQNVHNGAIEPQSKTENQIDENTITSPSGKIQVVLTVQTNIPVGGSCSNDNLKLKYLQVDTTPDYKEGRFAAYVVTLPKSAFYEYHAGLQKNTDAIKEVSLTSNTACNLLYSEYIDRPSSLSNVPLTRTLLAIKFVELLDGNKLKPGIDEVKVAEKLSGAEYEQAKKIVQSVYIKS